GAVGFGGGGRPLSPGPLKAAAARGRKTRGIGKEWPATKYEIGREKIGEYARVIGLDNPVHFDREAARAAGYRDVVAPPMFCVVYSASALGPAMFDDEVGMNFAAMVHGGQEFEWGEPACAGDEI